MTPAARACPQCSSVGLRDLRTQHGTMGWCPQCHGHWAVRAEETSLAPFITQAVERLQENARAGRCSLGLHDVRPQDERCTQCPESTHRCPSCAARLVPGELQQQRVEVCTRCPGLWLETNGLVALRRTRPQQAFVRLGRGGSFWLGRDGSPSLAMRILGVIGVGALYVGLQASGDLLWWLLGALWRFILAHLGM